MSNIKITFNDCYSLDFQVIDHSVSSRWLHALDDAIKNYMIDDPKRFYGFSDNEKSYALQKINSTINTINSYSKIITRTPTDINDYDTLNYLHSIFEIHHGLLDQQTSQFYSMPHEYRHALAQLNIDVHRCESVVRGNKPRIVVTYYNQKKYDQNILTHDDLTLMSNRYEFGTIYLNYVEIGKTLEDLAKDNDQYISDAAFKPFINFAASFNIKFWDSDLAKVKEVDLAMNKYYDEHVEFFQSLGYYKNHPHLRPGSIPVAKIIKTESNETILANIKANAIITNIEIQ